MDIPLEILKMVELSPYKKTYEAELKKLRTISNKTKEEINRMNRIIYILASMEPALVIYRKFMEEKDKLCE